MTKNGIVREIARKHGEMNGAALAMDSLNVCDPRRMAHGERFAALYLQRQALCRRALAMGVNPARITAITYRETPMPLRVHRYLAAAA
jgi:hypothetical protein